MMNLTNAMICWNPGTAQVALVAWPDSIGVSRQYSHTGGAAYRVVREAPFEERKASAYIEAMHLIVRDRVEPMAVHRAFLGLEEYVDGLSADMPRT